jgi:glycosyltransferase involved in cell wall biosynthesis
MLKEVANPITISVIIPVYNGQDYLLESIQSVCEQEYDNLEIIIVDDGSTDGTAELIYSMKKRNTIKYFYQQNKGPASARNMGLEKASGEWIAFLDSDDLWPKSKISRCLESIKKNNEVEIVWGMTEVFFQSEELKSKFIGSDFAKKPIFNTYLGAVFTRKSVFEKTGLFDTSLRYCEDLDWYQKTIEKKIKTIFTNSVELYYRVHYTNSTHDNFSLNKNLIRMLKNKLSRK